MTDTPEPSDEQLALSIGRAFIQAQRLADSIVEDAQRRAEEIAGGTTGGAEPHRWSANLPPAPASQPPSDSPAAPGAAVAPTASPARQSATDVLRQLDELERHLRSNQAVISELLDRFLDDPGEPALPGPPRRAEPDPAGDLPPQHQSPQHQSPQHQAPEHLAPSAALPGPDEPGTAATSAPEALTPAASPAGPVGADLHAVSLDRAPVPDFPAATGPAPQSPQSQAPEVAPWAAPHSEASPAPTALAGSTGLPQPEPVGGMWSAPPDPAPAAPAAPSWDPPPLDHGALLAPVGLAQAPLATGPQLFDGYTGPAPGTTSPAGTAADASHPPADAGHPPAAQASPKEGPVASHRRRRPAMQANVLALVAALVVLAVLLVLVNVL